MSAVIEAVREGADNRAPSTNPECPRCGQTFQRKRKDQRFCSRPCQKATTHNASRGPRTTAECITRRHEKRRQWATLAYLNETYYGTVPSGRLGLLKWWLDLARGGDATLRAALTRPDFTKWKDNTQACFRRSKSYPPVPYLTYRFCQHFLDCKVADWVQGRSSEPETGEVIDTTAIAA